jgi:zona occludens toxin (predicted ATPase)
VVSGAPGRLDTTAPAGPTLSSGRYVATGIIGFVNARLTLQVAEDQGWTIEVDNDKDDRVDFVVHAGADEVRALLSSR